MYKCKYFTIKELVHPNNLSIPENILWMLLDERVLRAADKIRELYGPIYVNSGTLKDCGLRDINSLTGAKYSQHKFGRALDLHIMSIEKQKLTAEQKTKAYNEIRQQVLLIPELKDINVEIDIPWFHIDTGNRPARTFRG